MSGFGERFRKAGYEIPKPLILINNRPIISYVIDMFPGEKNFTFICNNEHLKNSSFMMEKTIKKYCPTAKIIGISSHKLGPVYAIAQCFELINDDEPTIVNYCDFTCYWDWTYFKKIISKHRYGGVIPAYRGFHPHSLGKTNYAYIKENNFTLIDIREKKSFTSNKMNEYASSGTYFFNTGRLMKEAFKYTLSNDLKVNNEYYVSLAYKYLLKNNIDTLIYPLQHFMQWGTPEDLKAYLNWDQIFKKLLLKDIQKNLDKKIGTLILPMAGKGKRFQERGYRDPKPLIKVSGDYMVIQTLKMLPKAGSYSFTLLSSKASSKIKNILQRNFSQPIIKILKAPTDGQAKSAKIAYDNILKDKGEIESPLTIAACDNGNIFNFQKFSDLISKDKIDIIVWGVRGHPNAIKNPKMYGWIEERNGKILNISVKEPLSNILNDPIITGTFTFKDKAIYEKLHKDLIDANYKVNNEYYVDSLIDIAVKKGLNCQLFEIDHYLSWGTPDELLTFQYWQSCFHKWSSHQYLVENDKLVTNKNSLINTFYNFTALDELKKSLQ